MTRYATGRRFEWQTRDALKTGGAVFVMRAAGSKGPADLVAVYPEWVWFVQCKVARPTAEERAKVQASASATNQRWAMVWKDGGGGDWLPGEGGGGRGE